MSFPPGTEMFQFSGFASPKLCIHFGDTFVTNFPVPARKLERENWRRWVSPFGNLRVKGCSHLTAAYRSVPRPSSPVYAKASTNCPYLTLENPHHQRQIWNSVVVGVPGASTRSCGPRMASRRSRIRGCSHSTQLDN